MQFFKLHIRTQLRRMLLCIFMATIKVQMQWTKAQLKVKCQISIDRIPAPFQNLIENPETSESQLKAPQHQQQSTTALGLQKVDFRLVNGIDALHVLKLCVSQCQFLDKIKTLWQNINCFKAFFEKKLQNLTLTGTLKNITLLLCRTIEYKYCQADRTQLQNCR